MATLEKKKKKKKKTNLFSRLLIWRDRRQVVKKGIKSFNGLLLLIETLEKSHDDHKNNLKDLVREGVEETGDKSILKDYATTTWSEVRNLNTNISRQVHLLFAKHQLLIIIRTNYNYKYYL
jgi:hypothetical protein